MIFADSGFYRRLAGVGVALHGQECFAKKNAGVERGVDILIKSQWILKWTPIRPAFAGPTASKNHRVATDSNRLTIKPVKSARDCCCIWNVPQCDGRADQD